MEKEQDNAKWVQRLNDVLAVDYDAAAAYRACVERIRTASIREQFVAYQADHERHVRELTAWINRLGGKARTHADLKGQVLRGFTAVTSLVGDEATLRAMQGNEQLSNRVYQEALDAPWPDDLRQLLARNCGDEQRHLSWIREAIRRHAWAPEEPAQHP